MGLVLEDAQLSIRERVHQRLGSLAHDFAVPRAGCFGV
jgi:hypothetical protein